LREQAFKDMEALKAEKSALLSKVQAFEHDVAALQDEITAVASQGVCVCVCVCVCVSASEIKRAYA